jgi:hypothetical protein
MLAIAGRVRRAGNLLIQDEKTQPPAKPRSSTDTSSTGTARNDFTAFRKRAKTRMMNQDDTEPS